MTEKPINILRQPAPHAERKVSALDLLGRKYLTDVSQKIEAKINEEIPYEEIVSGTIEDIYTMLQIDEKAGASLLAKLHARVNLYDTFNQHFHSELAWYDAQQESFDSNGGNVRLDPYAANLSHAMLSIIKKFPTSYGFGGFFSRQGFLPDVVRIAGIEYDKIDSLSAQIHGDPSPFDFREYLFAVSHYKNALEFVGVPETLDRWKDFLAFDSSIADMWRNVHNHFAQISYDWPEQAQVILKLVDIDPEGFVKNMLRNPVSNFVLDFYKDAMSSSGRIRNEGSAAMNIALAVQKIQQLMNEHGLSGATSNSDTLLPTNLNF